MNRMNKKFLGFFGALLLCAPLSTWAAPILGGGGELLGASGITVGSFIYDVSFIDGSCTSVYSGCDETSDFTFQNLAEADSASQALIDQVFLGIYNTSPELTNGCTATDRCHVTTAYGFTGTSVHSASARIHQSYASVITHSAMTTLLDQSNPSNGSAARVTFAKWSLVGPSAVPEPSLMLLLPLALAGLFSTRRRQTQA